MNTLSYFDNRPRREILLTLVNALSNEDCLDEIAGENALLDCALYLVAKHDSELKAHLDAHLDTEDLSRDIRHVIVHRSHQSLRKERSAKYARV